MEIPKSNTVEYLKQLIIAEIEAQNRASVYYQKILRRISILLFFVLLLVIGMAFTLGYIVYLEKQPQSEVNKALKAIQGIETRIGLQREYINLNTEKLNKMDTAVKNKGQAESP